MHGAFDLLPVLVELRGRVVSKDGLLRRVWPGLVVEENNLSVQMTALRKAIGTVPNRGYQFTATFSPLTPAHPMSGRASATCRRPPPACSAVRTT